MRTSLCVLSAVSLTAVAAHGDSFGQPQTPFLAYTEINCSDNELYDVDDMSDSSSVISSSLLYEGGAYVLSEAMMIQGGDDSTMMILESESDEDFHEDEEEDDDDDDDEDDGHSSMLSNASLRRNKALAVGSIHELSPSDQSTPHMHRDSASSAQPPLKHSKQQQLLLLQSSLIANKVLLVRGGGVASTIVNNELAKKLLVAAVVTLVFEGVIGHVLEFFKIVMQTSPPGTTYSRVFHDITNKKGFFGMWDGFVPWGVIQAVLKGGVFGLAHATASNVLKPLAQEGKIPMQLALTLAGGIGGGFQGYVLSPTLLMKTRVMTNPIFREKMSMLKTTWLSFCIGAEVVQKEGFMTLMKGSNVFATKRVFDWSTRYYFSDLFESLFLGLKGDTLSPVERSLSSFLGGVASTCVTLPLDVLVAKTQDAKKAGVKVSAVKMFKDELNEVGWRGLKDRYMQGFEARLLHVCLTTVVLKTGAPIVYDMLFGVKR